MKSSRIGHLLGIGSEERSSSSEYSSFTKEGTRAGDIVGSRSRRARSASLRSTSASARPISALRRATRAGSYALWDSPTLLTHSHTLRRCGHSSVSLIQYGMLRFGPRHQLRRLPLSSAKHRTILAISAFDSCHDGVCVKDEG